MTWFAIRCAPQKEFALAGRCDDDGVWVNGILERKGYTVALPTETKWRRPRKATGKRVAVQYPMFCGYIFVRGPIPWLHLMAERLVIGVVGFDGTPAPISDAEMSRVIGMSGSAIPHQRSVNTHRAIRPGERVMIAEGPFAGQIVRVENLHGTKARIFMNLFGTQKTVEIDAGKLDAA